MLLKLDCKIESMIKLNRFTLSSMANLLILFFFSYDYLGVSNFTLVIKFIHDFAFSVLPAPLSPDMMIA